MTTGGLVAILAVALLAAGCNTRFTRYEKKLPAPAVAAAVTTPPPAEAEPVQDTGVPVGLSGDSIPGEFSPPTALTATVGSLLSDLAKAAKVSFYPSTLSRKRGLLGRRMTVQAGPQALNGLVDRLCRDAAMSCFFTSDYKAIAAYDPMELDPHREEVIGGGGRIRVAMPKPIRRPPVPVSFAQDTTAPTLTSP